MKFIPAPCHTIIKAVSCDYIQYNMRYKFICVLVISLIYICQVQAQNTPVTTIPFELRSDNRIYIKCVVNESDSLTFMFDTGAQPMVINQSILPRKLVMNFDGEANNNGANGISKVKMSSKNKLSFGGITMDSISFIGVDYGASPFDGVFGNVIMKKYIIEVDYKKKKMMFYEPATYVYNTKEYDKLSVDMTLDVPVTKAAVFVNSKKYRGKFEFDTGSDDGLILTTPFANKYDIVHQLKTIAHTAATGSDGTVVKSPVVILPEIGIAEKHFYQIPATLSTSVSGVSANKKLAGIFGNTFFKRFNLIIDLSHNQIFIKPNNLTHTPYYDFLVK